MGVTTLIYVGNSEGCGGAIMAGPATGQGNTAEMAGTERELYRELRARVEATGGDHFGFQPGLPP